MKLICPNCGCSEGETHTDDCISSGPVTSTDRKDLEKQVTKLRDEAEAVAVSITKALDQGSSALEATESGVGMMQKQLGVASTYAKSMEKVAAKQAVAAAKSDEALDEIRAVCEQRIADNERSIREHGLGLGGVELANRLIAVIDKERTIPSFFPDPDRPGVRILLTDDEAERPSTPE